MRAFGRTDLTPPTPQSDRHSAEDSDNTAPETTPAETTVAETTAETTIPEIVAETVAETVAGPDADDAQSPAFARTGPRRRAASPQLRVAGRRGVGGDEDEDGVARLPRGSRASALQSDGVTRLGPRAQQRAARAALADPLGGGDHGAADGDADADDHDADHAVPGQNDMARSEDGRRIGAAALTDGPAVLGGAARPASAPRPMPPGDILTDDEDGDDDRQPGVGGRRRNGPRAEKRAARAIKSNDAANYVVVPTVGMAQMRPRHYGVIALFVLMVILPTISYSLYLWTKAANQYQSNVGFGSRTEDAPSTFSFLGALGGVSQSGSSDMDILSQFIISQELVAKLDQQMDLKALYSKAVNDPMNAFATGGTIEDLVAYWQHMVIVNYDNGTGLMTLEVYAFDPQDAKKIAEAILVESTKIINDLSMTAQVDTTRYSKDALTASEKKLGDARLAVLDYQVRNGIVDPTNVIASQNSVISTLNQQLATTQIELDMLSGTVGSKDLRISTLNRRVEVIRNRIAEEQSKVGTDANGSTTGFAKLMQDFERLRVDQDFAEKAYLASLAAYDQALNDAQHKTRYLATYVAPTLAEAPTAPNRPLAALVVALAGFLMWSVIVLIYYALRDRR